MSIVRRTSSCVERSRSKLFERIVDRLSKQDPDSFLNHALRVGFSTPVYRLFMIWGASPMVALSWP